MRVADWLAASEDQRQAKLAELTDELARLYIEEGELLAQERRAKVTAWRTSQATSVTQRDREAEAAALEESTAVFRLRGEIRALESQIMFLKLLGGV